MDFGSINLGYAARFGLLALILAVNGFFAAAEVALLSVRESRLRQLAEEGSAGAKTALTLLSRPEKLLSVTQIGVTLASLGLGWAGEDTFYSLLTLAFHSLATPALAAVIRVVCFVLSFLVMTYCHVVIGEVVPKNLAIDKADRLAVLVAPVLMLFYRITAPFVSVVERSVSGTGKILGVKGVRHGGGHSAEELRHVVSSSRHAGHLPAEQEGMIQRILDLEEYTVREIMRPRREIVSIAIGSSLDQVLEAMVESQHSRLPVWREKPEQMVGVVFFKDMLRVWHDRRVSLRRGRNPLPFDLAHLMRKPIIVPETKPIVQILGEFRQGHTHIALVVDEFGTVTGLVTVEDVLEQIVGEIADEFDETLVLPHDEDEPRELDEEMDGATTIRDFALTWRIELPADAGFETLAGFLLAQLGHIPGVGESVEFEGIRFTVTAMERNRIARVHVEKITEPPSETSGGGDQEGRAEDRATQLL